MSRMSDLLTIQSLAPHCTNYDCAKCIARSRWSRRKGWHSPKSQVRKNTRKEVMPT